MRALLRDNVIEAAIGLLVVLLGLWFVFFAWQRTGGGHHGGFDVKARFGNISGIGVGTDVRVAGMKIGQVTSSALDPKSYQAVLTLALDRDVKLPADSSAAITSEGILGGSYIALLPGGDPALLKAGDEIVDTQSSVDLMSMIGQYINRTGSDTPATGAAAGGASAGGATPTLKP